MPKTRHSFTYCISGNSILIKNTPLVCYYSPFSITMIIQFSQLSAFTMTASFEMSMVSFRLHLAVFMYPSCFIKVERDWGQVG